MVNGRFSKKTTKKNNKNQIVVWLFLVIIALSSACSEKVRSRVLNYVFDGVPDKNKIDSTAIVLVAVADTSKIAKIAVIAAVPIYSHDPYKEKDCSKCHDASAPGKMPFAQDQLCYSCHTDFKTEYKVVHGPVAGGFCTSCHAPHFSENKKLLTRINQDLCLNCHSKDLVIQNEVHADIGSSNCTECHNPHGGSDRFILN